MKFLASCIDSLLKLGASVLIYVMWPASYNFWATRMVLLTVKLNFVLAACCKVDVMNGALGFTLTGFCIISSIVRSDFWISSWIFLASSSLSKGWDFFLFKEKGIINSSFIRVMETSQNSSGINSWINLSLSSKTLNATDWTLPADSPLAIFFHNKGDNSKPMTLSRNLLALYAFTRSKSISFGSSKESIIADFVIWLNLTLEYSYLLGPSASLRCHAIASPSRSRSVAR